MLLYELIAWKFIVPNSIRRIVSDAIFTNNCCNRIRKLQMATDKISDTRLVILELVSDGSLLKRFNTLGNLPSNWSILYAQFKKECLIIFRGRMVEHPR